MSQQTTDKNDYDFCRADGTRCPLGICRMWNVQAHEAARLPMIYAAAWDTTGNEKYQELWRKYVDEAVTQSSTPSKNSPAYALLQMQCSLELLCQCETNEIRKGKIEKVMKEVSSLARRRLSSVVTGIAKKNPAQRSMLGPDWRRVGEWKYQNGYLIPQWGPYREVWHLTREAGESALIPLLVAGSEVGAEQEELLSDLIMQTDYLHNSSCGIIYHLAAFWKSRRHKMIQQSTVPDGMEP